MRVSISLAVVMAMVACSSKPPIANGYYINTATGGELIVRDRKIKIRLPTQSALTTETSGTYSFRLHRDGWVRLFASSRDTYYRYVVADGLLYWTGSAFEIRDRRDGTVVTYTPAPR